MDTAPGELALVPQGRAGQRGNKRGRRPFLGRRQGARGPRLVVVLQEPDQAALVLLVGLQVPAHRLGALVQDPVVEPLVVAEVEPLLLQGPFEVPVGLRGEDHVRVET
ncbi:hypothetical protein, partial [Streptomyces sp. NPDC059900]|uniref:hypothetical protein n=1 Tax=Streptomyces sp. NPDC059900 TaxID=3155816 RepID=UPI003CFEF840